MSIPVGKKIRLIREAEKMGRKEFSDLTGIGMQTLIKIEKSDGGILSTNAELVLKHFGMYTLWMWQDVTAPEIGQISPEIKKARDLLGKTGTEPESRHG